MITVLGAQGYIGSHLVRRLTDSGREHIAVTRDTEITRRPMGTVIYCIGVTADFRTRPLDTVDAHVARLVALLRGAKVDRLVYLSSTRLYRRTGGVAREDAVLSFDPTDPSDLYDLSKAMGESVALTTDANHRVVRLSNVYGDDMAGQNFLASVLHDAVRARRVELESSLDSCKDYVSIEAACDGILAVAEHGSYPIYNIASGTNVSHAQIASALQKVTGCAISVRESAPTVRFPEVRVDRASADLGYVPSNLLEDLPSLIERFSKKLEGKS